MKTPKLRLSLLLCLLCLPSLSFATVSIWQALRQSFKLSSQNYNPDVRAQIEYLRRHPDEVRTLATNARPYLYYILETVKSENLPGELALLPLIESNYNPFAYSKAGAAGLWQLMPGTGSGLGVKQNWWYDGRRGVISSTKAAITYLKYLNHFFSGNWILAIAAYGSGEGTVLNAIRRNIRYHRSIRFWSLALPRETRAYLPRLLALASIIKNPRYYGVSLPDVPYEPYFKAVPITHQLDLTQAAKLAGMSYAELVKLNPGHNRWATAPNTTSSLLLPIDKVETFLKNQDKLGKQTEATWHRHVVSNGESLSVIANHYHTRVALIKELNQLSSNIIKPGQTLLLPDTSDVKPASITSTQKQQRIDNQVTIGPHKIIHIVQAGDSLLSIANKYQLKAAEIAFWNQLQTNATLTAGKTLIIWKKQSNSRTYTVKNGDSLSVIAKRNHIKLKELLVLNQLSPKSVIHINQSLKLP